MKVCHVDGKGASPWTIFSCLPRCIGSELGQKWSSLDSKQHHSGECWYPQVVTTILEHPTQLHLSESSLCLGLLSPSPTCSNSHGQILARELEAGAWSASPRLCSGPLHHIGLESHRQILVACALYEIAYPITGW